MNVLILSRRRFNSEVQQGCIDDMVEHKGWEKRAVGYFLLKVIKRRKERHDGHSPAYSGMAGTKPWYYMDCMVDNLDHCPVFADLAAKSPLMLLA